MARRTINQIRSDMLSHQPAMFEGLSSSQSAEWRLWVNVVSYAIWLFEGVLEVFKVDIEGRVEQLRPGSLSWYAEKSLEFQLGDDLIVDQFGVMKYSLIDLNKRVVKKAAVSETDGVVIFKVAKENTQQPGEYIPLSIEAGELLQFERYIDNIKYAGTETQIVSLPADIVEYEVAAYFDPVFTEETIEENIKQSLNELKVNLPYDAILYRTVFLKAVLAAPGVITATVDYLAVTQGPSTDEVIVKHVLEAGYFNYDEDSIINLINNNE